MHESGSSFFLELSWRHPAVDDGAATRYGINRSERFLLWGYGRDVMFFLLKTCIFKNACANKTFKRNTYAKL